MEAVHTLNLELMAKIKALVEETHRLEEVEKAKTNLATELASLREQMERVKVNAMADFKASQPFIDVCVVYYGDWFEEFLKQVGFVYPDLDLSNVSLDNPLPTTPAIGDTFDEEPDDFAHTEEQIPIDDGVVIVQPILDGAITFSVLSAEDPPIKDAENPSVLDAPSA